MGAAKPTQADYEAADEMFKLHGDLVSPSERDEQREGAARFRAANGDDAFRLVYGLRPAESHYDQFLLAVLERGQTPEAIEQLSEIESQREVDEMMVAEVYHQVSLRLIPYAKIMRRVLHYRKFPKAKRGRIDFAEVHSDLESLCAPIELCPFHFDHVNHFAKEVRVDRGMDFVRHGRFDSNSALEAAEFALDRLNVHRERIVEQVVADRVPPADRPREIGKRLLRLLRFVRVAKLATHLEQERLILQSILGEIAFDEEQRQEAEQASPPPADDLTRRGDDKPFADTETFTANFRQHSIELGNTIEFKLFERLSRRIGIYIPIGRLASDVWDDDMVEKVTIQKTVCNLRRRLKDTGLILDGSNKGHYALKIDDAA